jgi:hypothetical protein
MAAPDAAVGLTLTGAAEAHDYSADLICQVTEPDDEQRSAWSFALAKHHEHIKGFRAFPIAANRPGVPRSDDRKVLNGIYWRLRTGSPWAEVPERLRTFGNLLQSFCPLG